MTRKEMSAIVSDCWAAACEADMPSVGPMEQPPNMYGQTQYSMIRMQAFQTLLQAAAAPRNVQVNHKVQQEKEPWQE